ncbi:hypothetical protein M0802_015975 [Mischocyttarus mexicanus]|nr:hypothetical protein M0802_015975 [Mischocyttarus mexicanus]
MSSIIVRRSKQKLALRPAHNCSTVSRTDCSPTKIAKVRASLFQISGVKKEPLILPEPEGEVTTLMEKVYVPVKEHPDVSYTLLIFFLK